jgi:hypothetical protein
VARRPETPRFEPAKLLDALRRRDVEAIVVGAYAAELLAIPVVTIDLDLIPAPDPANLQRLAEALHDFGATVRVRNLELGPVRLPADGGLIAKAPILNLHLPGIGDVDVIHRAAEATADGGGPLDFAALRGRATRRAVAGSRLRVLVMSEADWVASKRAPPVREKDVQHLRLYERWRAGRGGG